ncbi:proteasome subunit beta type [Gregarina niphandrodes]|uniref:Proteasome subunit beta n=1 Tax=Gregarina niphandrodes TaxID=110365 RepID=A0A023AYN2_GRENI|nr:proteasome subunit beta type [Gregarina niphandrodes]EZG43563.1 proteasome subunit beta type [Gregarina niphandrodes]|eukprot:XP_011133207.1 proteasome subunit beta type [Gregarina niphandrodes]
MDTVIGIKGKDFVLCAADKSSAYSIIRLVDTQDKVCELDGNKLMACAGPDADRQNFMDYIQKNVHLRRLMSQGRSLSPKATANYARTELALALRKAPYQVDALVGGINPVSREPELYLLDYLGTLVASDRAAHGYGSHFIYGLLDREYQPDMTLEQATDLVRKCIHELNTRFLVHKPAYLAKAVTADGKIQLVTL